MPRMTHARIGQGITSDMCDAKTATLALFNRKLATSKYNVSLEPNESVLL